VIGDGEVFERATDAETVALDKTGTLTTGEMTVVETAGADRGLELAAAVERLADHPVAGAVVAYAVDDPALDPPAEAAVADFETHPGRGVSAVIDGDVAGADTETAADGGTTVDRAAASGDDPDERVVVGRPELLAAEGLAVPEDLRERAERAAEGGQVPVLVGWDDHARSLLVAGDEPRPGWKSVVDELAENRRVVVVSGDGPAATERFREHPAVDEAFAGVPPEGKAEVIERLRADGPVAMVGDGSNDAPALAAADVGIAMGGGTALAGDAADAVVLEDDLAAVPDVFALTAGTRRRVRTNLGWAFLYNAVAVPTAALGLLSPAVAAVAMAASSLLVVTNSSRPVVDR
jgi:Cu2+-exporting ATPase